MFTPRTSDGASARLSNAGVGLAMTAGLVHLRRCLLLAALLLLLGRPRRPSAVSSRRPITCAVYARA